MEVMFSKIALTSRKWCGVLEQARGGRADVYDIATRASIDIILTCGFGFPGEKADLSELIRAVSVTFTEVAHAAWNVPGFLLPWGCRREKERLGRSCGVIRTFLRTCLVERMSGGSSGDADVLDHIIQGD